MTTIEVAGIFWGCGMIAGAVLIHAQTKQTRRLRWIVLLLGLALLIVSFIQSWDIYLYNYPLTPQDPLDFQSLDVKREVERRGRAIVSAFMMLSGAMTISASLNMRKYYGTIFIMGVVFCVLGLFEGAKQMNTSWDTTKSFIFASSVSIPAGVITGYLVTALAKGLGALFKQRP